MRKTQTFDYGVTCVIMGGGAGSRLYPLTYKRAKPAVPLGGKFRLIDIPISNCINSGLNRVFILTQFNSTSLHRHISQSYHFHRFSRGFVEILAAQQTPELGPGVSSWYQGTADAVRKNLPRFHEAGGDEVLILSGDQIYQMDLREILATHRGGGGLPRADVTIGAVLVDKERARSLGVLRAGPRGDLTAFVEKPGYDEGRFTGLEASPELLAQFRLPGDSGPWYLGNMGIYVFDLDGLDRALANTYTDFGKEILPLLLGRCKMRAHLFNGYWEDIGTIKAFHEANLDLTRPVPRFNFYDQDAPIYTRARLLPASKIQRATIVSSVISDGCIVESADLVDALVGVRSVIRGGARLKRTYMMGADFYEDEASRGLNRIREIPDLGLAEDCEVENAIIDHNARVGRSVKLLNRQGHQEYEDEYVTIRQGIIVVRRDGIVPDGYSI
jgi:glucose-1-phosphate adenylyltransferase